MSFEQPAPERGQPERLRRDGVGLEVPHGWEGRIRRHLESGRGERTFPVVHAATVPLIGMRGDYGGGVVERLEADDVFLTLVEFGPEEASTALFPDVDELPRLEVSMFHRNQLQRRIRGQAGVQRFFTYKGRPFCLYVVLGSVGRAPLQVARANALLSGIEVDEA